jgi:hypothetical protein
MKVGIGNNDVKRFETSSGKSSCGITLIRFALILTFSPRRRNSVCAFSKVPKSLLSSPSLGLRFKGVSVVPRSGRRFSLSSGERAGVRASVPLTFLPALVPRTVRFSRHLRTRVMRSALPQRSENGFANVLSVPPRTRVPKTQHSGAAPIQ